MMNVESVPKFVNSEPSAHETWTRVPRVSRSFTAPGLVEREGVLRGTIPAWLSGRLVRTAPAVFESGSFRVQHWFDGLGMLYGFRFAAGRATFAQRLLESEAASDQGSRLRRASFASTNQRSLWQRIFEPVPKLSDNTNVNVLRFGSEWVAMTESPHQLRIDDRTLAVQGRVAVNDALPKSLTPTAHPHFDFAKNVCVNLGTALGNKGEIIAFEQAAPGAPRREIGRLVCAEVPYVHSFGLTQKSVIVVGHPWQVRPLSLLWSNRGYAEHFRWKPELGTTFTRISRGDGALTTYQTEAFFSFHTVNSYEDGDDLVVDLLAYSDPSIVDDFRIEHMLQGLTGKRPKLTRARLGANGKARLETLSDVGFEFPIINYRRTSGARQRYVWGSTARGDGADVLRIDCENGTVSHFGASGYTFGEPVFVARPGARAEDDGVLLSVGSNGEHSQLVVLDAATLEAHAEVELDIPIPLGFHGSFSRA